jgi:hypothetical protein
VKICVLRLETSKDDLVIQLWTAASAAAAAADDDA